MSWLSLAIWTSIVFGFVILPLGRDSQASLARWLALAGSVLGFLVTLPLYTGFQARPPLDDLAALRTRRSLDRLGYLLRAEEFEHPPILQSPQAVIGSKGRSHTGILPRGPGPGGDDSTLADPDLAGRVCSAVCPRAGSRAQ